MISIQQVTEPEAERRRIPGDLLPRGWHTRIVDVIECILQILVHDNGAINGQLEILQGTTHNGDHPLHAIDLLLQEDVQRLQRSLLLQCSSNFMWNVILWQFAQHVVALPVDDGFACFTTAGTRIFRLNVDNGGENRIGGVRLIGDIRVGVKTEDERTVEETHCFDVRAKVLNGFAARDLVIRCEFELLGEHVVQKPYARVRVQETFIEIIGYTTSIMN